MKIHISLAENHIQEGVPDDSHSCAFALAVADALESTLYERDLGQPYVTPHMVTVSIWNADSDDEIEWEAEVPVWVGRQIRRFDSDWEMEVLEVDLEFKECE